MNSNAAGDVVFRLLRTMEGGLAGMTVGAYTALVDELAATARDLPGDPTVAAAAAVAELALACARTMTTPGVPDRDAHMQLQGACDVLRAVVLTWAHRSFTGPTDTSGGVAPR